MARTATVVFKSAEDAKLAMQLTNTPFLDRGIMIHAQTFGLLPVVSLLQCFPLNCL